jgi:hypothetical protein
MRQPLCRSTLAPVSVLVKPAAELDALHEKLGRADLAVGDLVDWFDWTFDDGRLSV